jgi:hypothetical protein
MHLLSGYLGNFAVDGIFARVTRANIPSTAKAPRCDQGERRLSDEPGT